MDKEKFIGTWNLISNEWKSDDGQVTYPLGRNTLGQLMYDGKGNMSAQLTNPARPRFASDDWLKGTLEEMKSAFQGYRCYFGTYDVDEKKKIVTHHVKGSIFPNYMGQDNVRYYEFSGNRLILTTVPVLIGGKNLVARLVWERL